MGIGVEYRNGPISDGHSYIMHWEEWIVMNNTSALRNDKTADLEGIASQILDATGIY
jgi:hypothetical protein